MARYAKVTIIRFACETPTDSGPEGNEDEVYCLCDQGNGELPVYQLGDWRAGDDRPMGTVVFDGSTEPTRANPLPGITLYFNDADTLSADDFLGSVELTYDEDGAVRLVNGYATDCLGPRQGPDSVQFRMNGSEGRFSVWLKVETYPLVEVRFPLV